MKHTKTLALIGCLLILNGCATILPGNDPVVVRAEQTLKSSVTIMHSFLTYEEKNRIVLLQTQPEVNIVAEKIRREAPPIIQSVKMRIRDYKANKNVQNKQFMDVMINVLEGMADEVSQQLTKY